MKLYTAPTGNGRKPLILLHILGVPHEVHMFDWPTKEIKEKWYLELNPHGLVPTLVDGGVTLCESNAILQYLADTYDKDNRFSYPHGDPLYWQQLRWLYYQSTQFSDALARLLFYKKVRPDDEWLVETAFAQINKVYAVLEGHLSQNKWFVGDKFTIADLAFAVGHFRRLEKTQGSRFDIADFDKTYPHVAEWYKSVLAVDGVEEGFKLK
ncbi:Glutathione S-transferase-like protein tpcF [Candida viswanathii]|uniref:Glutathione S-transferase-like protein tpcF n=1 Tax=Candida viswanathii TaxID=5486 RepID=A0A367XRN7_9ASCO|nr:Glutathione S-transferase-like protein tpcF [Candida viswanathii]